MARIKKNVVETPTKEVLSTLAKEVAYAHSSLKKYEAEIEHQVQNIRKKYEDKIRLHQETIVECTALLEAYALEHRNQFEKKRSLDITHGVIGFRISNPAVKIARGMSKKIIGILETAGFTRFLRQKQELDKELIIASRQDKELMKSLENLGLTVEQNETFYFETKDETIN